MTKRKFQVKTNFRHILFSVITFVLFLLLMEGGIRTFFYIKNNIFVRERSFSSYLGWKTEANIASTSVVKGYGEIDYSTQKYGFRVFGDTSTDKIKIFVIGDSFTQGFSVSDGKTYYDYLKNHDDNIEIFAYGGGGYGTLQEYMILDRYVDEIKPDMVLWQFMANDLLNNSHELESASFRNNNQMTRPYYENDQIKWLFPRQYRGWMDKAIQSSYLLRLLNIKLNILRAENIRSIEDEFSTDHPLFKKAINTTSEIMGLVKKRLGHIPVFAFAIGWPQTFQDICAKNSIHYIDGIDTAISQAKIANVTVDGTPYDTHWNYNGHSIAGQVILNYLQKNNYIVKAKETDQNRLPTQFDMFRQYRVRDDSKLLVTAVNLLCLNSDNSEGFDSLEGPYPQWQIYRQVRWMISPEAKIKFIADPEKDKGYSLNISVRSIHPSQHLKVFLNEELLLNKRFSGSSNWRSLSSGHVQFQKGENILKFTSSSFSCPDKVCKRKLYVLFDKLVFQN
jgi:hypothetical protein